MPHDAGRTGTPGNKKGTPAFSKGDTHDVEDRRKGQPTIMIRMRDPYLYFRGPKRSKKKSKGTYAE